MHTVRWLKCSSGLFLVPKIPRESDQNAHKRKPILELPSVFTACVRWSYMYSLCSQHTLYKTDLQFVAYNALRWILTLNMQFHIVRTLHEKAALNARFDTFLFSYSWLCMMYTALARSTRSSTCCLSWAANHKEADLKGEQLKQVSKRIQAAAGQQSNKE